MQDELIEVQVMNGNVYRKFYSKERDKYYWTQDII